MGPELLGSGCGQEARRVLPEQGGCDRKPQNLPASTWPAEAAFLQGWLPGLHPPSVSPTGWSQKARRHPSRAHAEGLGEAQACWGDRRTRVDEARKLRVKVLRQKLVVHLVTGLSGWGSLCAADCAGDPPGWGTGIGAQHYAQGAPQGGPLLQICPLAKTGHRAGSPSQHSRLPIGEPASLAQPGPEQPQRPGRLRCWNGLLA